MLGGQIHLSADLREFLAALTLFILSWGSRLLDRFSSGIESLPLVLLHSTSCSGFDRRTITGETGSYFARMGGRLDE